MKKVGLLTLPLKDNYGGLLQTIALHDCLKNLGCQVTLLQKDFYHPLWKQIIIALLERLPFQNIKKFRSRYRNSPLHQPHLDQMIPSKTRRIVTKEELARASYECEFDAVVVGSDQVWRFQYIDKVYFGAYFLDFLEGTDIKRISYAASFGLDYWEAPEKSKQVSNWLANFDALSVRESNGQKVCAELGRKDAVHVLDPTLLAGPKFFHSLVEKLPDSGRPELLYYVLDQSKLSEELLQRIQSELRSGIEVKRIYDKGDSFQSHSILQWVKSFSDAEFILTDSFHGMVFSVMFNKPFLAITNKERGASRFESFLVRLGLQHRLITEDSEVSVSALIEQPIDYCKVNDRLAQWRTESELFLKNALMA